MKLTCSDMIKALLMDLKFKFSVKGKTNDLANYAKIQLKKITSVNTPQPMCPL